MEGMDGRFGIERCAGSRCGARGLVGRVLLSLGAVGLGLVMAPCALASAESFTWTGRSTTSAEWSFDANWELGKAPNPGEHIATLAFPRLTGKACEDEPETHPCYVSLNDVSGLTAESLQLYDGKDYFIGGEELGLGSGGLSASPVSGAGGEAGAFLLMPLRLDASQKWSIADRSGGEIEENGLLLKGNLSGASSTLTIEQSNGSALILDNDTEVGPVAIEGASDESEHIDNGITLLGGGELNHADHQPVDLRRTYFAGFGSVGPLTTEEATLAVGGGETSPGGITASSVKLASSSGVIFEITGNGTTADKEYSQLVSEGPVDAAGAIVVEAAPPRGEEKAPCPTLKPGAAYTFVTTTQTLSGTFGNASEDGPEIPVHFASGCSQTSQTMRISYDRSGGVETVTGTVEAARIEREAKEALRKHEEEVRKQEEEAKNKQEEEAKKKREEALYKLAQESSEKEAARRNQELGAKKSEEFAGKKREEEIAAAAKHEEEEAAATIKSQEEEAAKTKLTATKEATPDATIAGTSLTVSPSGVFTVKIKCPGGEASCHGTITLRTLHAVAAGVSGRQAKSRAAIVTLASGSFTVAGGQSKSLTMHLSASGRKLLAHSHVLSARATVVAQNPTHETHTGEAIVTLRAQKPTHRSG
jgi:hypothetical protein